MVSSALLEFMKNLNFDLAKIVVFPHKNNYNK